MQERHQYITLDRSNNGNARIKITGVGGGGCNALESMIKRGLNGVEFIAVNTDLQALDACSAAQKIQVGVKVTRGLGAGADPNVGRKACEEDREKIAEMLRGTDMLFLTAGMGGGTGTGGLPVVASIAKSLDILTVAIVTKPFRWEGRTRMINAEKGIQELRQYVDSLIVIPNERIISVLEPTQNFFQALDKANEVLYEATRGIADIINIGGFINVDFADVRSVMQGSGQALMGCGIASGENRAVEAAQKAISSPFLEGISVKGAKSVLVNVTGSSNLTMQEITEGNDVIYNAAGDEVNVIFGCVRKEEMNDYVSYTVIATGFEQKAARPKTTTIDFSQDVKPKSTPVYEPVQPKQQKTFYKPAEQEPMEQPAASYNQAKAYRIQSPKASLPQEEEPLQTGFDFGRFKQVDYDDLNIENKKKKSEEDDDTSAFLRMIMD